MSRKRPPTRLNIELHGGRTVSLQRPPRGGRTATVRLLTPIAPVAFTACPICLAPDPGTVEHIPPAALGGVPMTLTCGRCNHGLGSRVEADLADWFDDVIARCRFTSAAVPGRRQAGRVALYKGNGDGFYLTLVGGDPAVRRGFVAGEFALEFSPPDPRRYRLALLKAAYLTWCLHVRTIPTTSSPVTFDAPSWRSAMPIDGTTSPRASGQSALP